MLICVSVFYVLVAVWGRTLMTNTIITPLKIYSPGTSSLIQFVPFRLAFILFFLPFFFRSRPPPPPLAAMETMPSLEQKESGNTHRGEMKSAFTQLHLRNGEGCTKIAGLEGSR